MTNKVTMKSVKEKKRSCRHLRIIIIKQAVQFQMFKDVYNVIISHSPAAAIRPTTIKSTFGDEAWTYVLVWVSERAMMIIICQHQYSILNQRMMQRFWRNRHIEKSKQQITCRVQTQATEEKWTSACSWNRIGVSRLVSNHDIYRFSQPAHMHGHHNKYHIHIKCRINVHARTQTHIHTFIYSYIHIHLCMADCYFTQFGLASVRRSF